MPARRWTALTVVALLLLVAGFGAAVIFAVSGPNRPDTGTNHALVIGIGKYAKWSSLDGPVKDAEAISKVLAEQYDFKRSNITLITDKTPEKPSLVNILTALDSHVRELGEKDNLFVFFSGHSTEDEEGETYWIPTDGKKKTKLTWLKHSSLIDEYFGAENFKAKNLLIVSDSHFSTKLLRKRSISLSPFDLRYTEKIVEKTRRRSREVIAFGDAHWAGSPDTDGLGLFTFYMLKALKDNQLEVIDVENLIFEEAIYNPIAKIAGTKLIRGRLRSPMSKGGQFVVSKLAPAVPVDVLTAAVSPDKGYPGDTFDFAVTTSDPADQVFVEIGGKRHPMSGGDTRWQLQTVIDKLGTTAFTIAAVNRNGVRGKIQRGKVTTIKKRAEIANVTDAVVSPSTGLGGDSYTFKATTDKPAARVALRIGDKTYAMQGSDTAWTVSRKVDAVGKIDFSVIASNEDGVPGKPGQGAMTLKPGIANVALIQAQPKTGFAGEEFTISVQTDRTAHQVNLDIDGQILAMTGKGTKWRLKRKIEEIGKKTFKVTAINVEGTAGTSRTGEIMTKKSPLPVPDIAAATVAVVAPGKGYAGDRFAVDVTTTAPSEKVLIDIEGKQFPMAGSGTQWRYIAKIDKIGTSAFTVVARNKDGAQGQAKDGIITATKVPARKVNVVTASVSPQRGQVGKPFRFAAKTDIAARGVTLLIGQNRYEMAGSGTDWKLERKIEQSGTIDVKVIARNADNQPGTPQLASLTAVKTRFKKNPDGTLTDVFTGKKAARFVDNGDDTITDRLTSLMWTRSPKQIALEYDEAVEYCRELKVKKYRGWRLPTITEWRRFTDKRQQNPSLPPGHPFVNIPTHVGYWSKSKHKFGSQYVYQMNLWYGKPGHGKKSEPSIVWPVRYADISG